MAGEALSSAQVREVQNIAELETRRYFDHYLNVVWPQQQKALREHTTVSIQRHDDADEAHGGVERRVNRLLWMLAGTALAGGGVGAGVMKAISVVGG